MDSNRSSRLPLPSSYDVFLDGLKQDMNKQKALLLQGAAGATHPHRKRYRDLTARVSRAVAGYGRTEVLTFLRAIAHLSHS